MRLVLVGLCALALGVVLVRRPPPAGPDESRVAALEQAVGAQGARLQSLESELAALRARSPEARAVVAPPTPAPFEADEMVAWVELAQARQAERNDAKAYEHSFAAMLKSENATETQAQQLRTVCDEVRRARATLQGKPFTDYTDEDDAMENAWHERADRDAAAILGGDQSSFYVSCF